MSVQGFSSLKYSDLFKPPEPASSTDSPKESEWKVVSHSRGRRRARSTPPPPSHISKYSFSKRLFFSCSYG